MPLLYRITTLGCRTNHAETREIESLLLSRGLRCAHAADQADLEIIHTCSVTTTAAAKSRQAIRRAVRRTGRGDGPDGPTAVIVTGCYAATDPDEAGGLIGSDGQVLGHHDPMTAPPGDHTTAPTMIHRLAARLDAWLASEGTRWEAGSIDGESRHFLVRTASPGSSADPRPGGSTTGHAHGPGTLPLPVVPPVPSAGRHVRAELKIQDGCDAHCTFCIIPRTRPVLRSKSVADTVAEARALVACGHGEIVLSGVFLGAYGHETALRRRQRRRGAPHLADLVDAVARVAGLRRLRLSSLEPGDVTPALLQSMVAHRPVVVPHLHLPLQSGADPVLRRMNRQYTVGQYLEMIEQVNTSLTDVDGLPPAISTDVICGFPGETEEDFERTLAVASRVGYLHMHVFPYSARPGTAAARWADRRIRPTEVRRRVRQLIDLEEHPERGLAIRYRRRLAGREVRVILEQPDPAVPGHVLGRCDHYALVSVLTDRPRGSVVHGRVVEVTADRILAEIQGGSTCVSLPVLESPRVA